MLAWPADFTVPGLADDDVFRWVNKAVVVGSDAKHEVDAANVGRGGGVDRAVDGCVVAAAADIVARRKELR